MKPTQKYYQPDADSEEQFTLDLFEIGDTQLTIIKLLQEHNKLSSADIASYTDKNQQAIRAAITRLDDNILHTSRNPFNPIVTLYEISDNVELENTHRLEEV